MRKIHSTTGITGVYRDKNSYYYQSYVTADPIRKAKVRKYGFKTPEEAYKAKLEYEEETLRDLRIKDKTKRLGYLISQFLKHKKTIVKLSTYYSVELLVRKYFIKEYSEYSIEEFATNSNLDKFRNKIEKIEMGTDWKNRVLLYAKDIYMYGGLINLVKPEVVNRVIVKTAKFVKTTKEKDEKNRENYWSLDEWKTFMAAIPPKSRWYPFFALFGQLGCRIGEIRGLQNKHVINNGTAIRIEQQASNKFGIGKTLITTPKSQSSYRTISISPRMAEILNTFMKVHNSFESPNHFLFFNTYTPIGIQAVRRRFDYFTKKAGLPRITIHGIRHSNCTWLLSKALNPQEIGQVSKRLGHSSTKITLDIYMGIHKQEDPLIQDTLNEIV